MLSYKNEFLKFYVSFRSRWSMLSVLRIQSYLRNGLFACTQIINNNLSFTFIYCLKKIDNL